MGPCLMRCPRIPKPTVPTNGPHHQTLDDAEDRGLECSGGQKIGARKPNRPICEVAEMVGRQPRGQQFRLSLVESIRNSNGGG